jgi:tetratricopeptide (TPR) repeat protein
VFGAAGDIGLLAGRPWGYREYRPATGVGRSADSARDHGRLEPGCPGDPGQGSDRRRAYDEAETLLTSLLAEYPGDPALTSDLVVAYQRTGRVAAAFELLQQALEHLNRALEIKPAVATVYELRGMCRWS